MFGASSNQPHHRPRGGQPGFKWWILILVLLVGFPLVVLQTVAPGGSYTPPVTPAATAGREGQDELEQFLPEYQPDIIPALDEGTTGTATEAIAEPTWLGMLDVVAKLALVLGLVYLVLMGLRWLQRSRRRPDDAGGTAIRVLETVGLAPGRSLHLVSAGEKTLLIGATDYQLCLLADLPNVSMSVTEEEAGAFEVALQRESAAPAEQPGVASSASIDWRVAVERLRAGTAGVRQALRKADDAPEP